MSAFKVPPRSQGKWLNLGDISNDGTFTKIKFDPEHGMIVKRVIPERVVELATKDNNYVRDQNAKGKLLGNTQRHWLPICSIPKQIDRHWQNELGNPREDPDAWKAWKRRLNSSEYRDFRTSEHKL